MLLRRTEATHVELLLLVGVKVTVMRLIRVHVLLDELVRRRRGRWRRLHHLTLANVLAIHVHAAVAHDLTARAAELRRLRHRRRLLVDEVLLESKVLAALSHHELTGLALHGELCNRSRRLINVLIIVVCRLVHFRLNCVRERRRNVDGSC